MSSGGVKSPLIVGWSQILRQSPIDWLLEERDPSIRYFTLRDILGKSEDEPELVSAKTAIPESRIVERILQRQNSQGYWEQSDSPYLPKYRSSYWTIMVLAQLGLDRTNTQMNKACESIFQFQQETGAFSSYSIDKTERATDEYRRQRQRSETPPSFEEWALSRVQEHQYSCLTGNMASALIRAGYKEDPRLKKALRWLMSIQNADGGWLCPYWKAHIRDKHGCFYGTVCPLEAFSEIRNRDLTKAMRETIDKGVEFLLMHRLFKADHHGFKIINKNWLTLSFPFFGYNILRGLDAITRRGYTNDERLDDAVNVLLQKRQKDGSWILESSPEGRMQANIEKRGEPSKWITLIALRTLKRLSAEP
jgi:hypothetical protein